MKREADTIAIELNHEKLFLQIHRGFLEDERRWHQWQQMLHEHMSYELHLVTQGSCIINIEGTRVPIEKGQAIVIAPRRHHGCRSLEGEFERFSVFFLPDEKADSLSGVLREKIRNFHVFSASETMLSCGRAILRDWNSVQSYRREKRQALLTTLMIDALRRLELVTRVQEDAEEEPSRMCLCDSYFSGSGWETDRTAGELAAMLHMSERQMNRCLQEFYGMNFREKLMHARMDGAAWLLCNSTRKVEEIAALVGYESESGFFKAFRKKYGVTPQQYRARNNF